MPSTMCLRFIIVLFVLNISILTFGKELYGTHSRNAELILKRVKRFRNSGPNSWQPTKKSERSEQSVSNCYPSKSTPRESVIIKSSASIEKGAVYLNAHNGKTISQCFDLCCQDPSCDTAIYEDKSDHRCYLFDCHDKCVFKPHENYTVWDVERSAGRPKPHKEEDELAHLPTDDVNGNSGTNHDDDDNNNNSDSDDGRGIAAGQTSGPSDSSVKQQDRVEVQEPSRTDDDSDNLDAAGKSPAPVQQQTPKPLQPVRVAPHTAGLSDSCASDVSCEDPNAGCYRGVCQCKEGFYNKDGLCRKICPQSNFECLGLGTLGRGPECIPKSQMCDSFMQCADGSDEFNCDNKASNSDSRSWKNADSSNWMSQPGSYASDRQRMEETQPRLPQGQQQQHMPVYDPHGNADISTPPENDQSRQSEFSLNARNHPQGNVKNGNSMNAVPSVRPNSLVPQQANPSMNNRNKLPAESNRQPVVGSVPDTNANTAYSQSSNVNNFHNVKDNLNTNGDEKPHRGSNAQVGSHQDKSVGGDSYTGTQGGLSHPIKSQTAQNRYPNNPDGHSHHQNPSNMAYSESGPLRKMPSNSGRISHPKTISHKEQGMQSYKSPSSQSAPSNSNHSPDSRVSGVSKPSRDRGSPRRLSNPQQRVPERPKNQLTSSHKSSSSSLADRKPGPSNGRDGYKNQPSSVLSSKTNSEGLAPNNRPSYPDSSLLSSSSSRQSGRQNWLDGNPYLSYGNNNQRQRQPQMPSRNNQYYDPSQYFSQYNTDSLDALPPSLLGDNGSQDDFTQFRGPYMDRQKPANRMPYPLSNGNSGYGGYPDSSFNNQYNPSNRFNYGGEYSNGNYQDPDFYPPLPVRNGKDYQPTGLYEDEQPNTGVAGTGEERVKGISKSGNQAATNEDKKPVIGENKNTLTAENKDAASNPTAPILKTNEAGTSHDSVVEISKNKTKTEASVPAVTPKVNATQPTTKKPHSPISHNKVYVTQEKVIIASATSEAEGPIIALSLGLAFTLILIVLLGCRLRNMKHRLRKGRPLNSNEADYLINGMYL